ncbi:MAG: hypothetical protein JW891_07270 [Candidatus Lokiarchaeota archaeon]|nr:hypothetical protein [Candidatus Lokiarchaeota archaeon]
MSYRIIVDLSHNEKIEFPEDALDEDDYTVDFIDKNEGPITFELLEDADVLFLGNIQHTAKGKEDKFSPDELSAIKRFVGEGGGLFLTTGSGGDLDIPMKLGSIRVLYKITGVRRFWNGTILEGGTNFLVNRENLLITDLFSHPITSGITELVFPNCTFFTLTEDVDDLINTSEKAEFIYSSNERGGIGPVPICVVSKFFNGRSVCLGSSDLLLEDNDFGLDAGDNLMFIENILKWLTFEI